jgi:hypothetical protein
MSDKLDFKEILSNFPSIEPFYEIIIHKKVHSYNAIMAIPEGHKCYAWFTIDNITGSNICYIIELDEQDRKKIKYISICKTSFKDTLSYGTILYGTFINNNKINKNNLNNKNRFNNKKIVNANNFFVENIYYYKGKDVTKDLFINKLNILQELFKNDISQQAIGNNYTIFGLPIMDNNFQNLIYNIEFLPYKIKYLCFKTFADNKSNCSLLLQYYKPGNKENSNNNNSRNTKELKEAIFKVYPDIDSDIYKLFVYNLATGNEEFYNTAYVPDYKTSVMLNQLFRNIKENGRLDALEESDDEDEFENEDVSKYVYLEKSYKMNCVYNQKFKRWVPVSVADNNSRIILRTMLL